MKLPRLWLICLILLLTTSLSAQVVDRYPYLQQATETSILVAWNTETASAGTLRWGSGPFALSDSIVEGTATQKHALTISGLQPNTQYFYQVSTAAGYSSAVEHFWTAKPLVNDEISFLHYGDCGYNNSIQNQLAGLMQAEEVDFAVVTGDVDQGVGDAYDNVFFGPYRNMLARDCHFTAIGNHDIIANGGTDFFDAFYQPTNNPQQSEHYYSFTWGHAKFICLDSNGDYSIGSDQHNFLMDEIRCRDQEWVFVFFHHPPWTNAWDPSYYVPFQPFYEYDGEDAMRTDLVPYFEQYGVDFILNGHSHCYQRGAMNGVNYVISGGAGTTSPDTRKCNTFPNFGTCAPNLQQELYINQYVRFRISGDAATYVCINPSGQVVDSVTVSKTWTPYAATLTTTGASGASAQDGSASAAVAGPWPPYSFAWSNGDTAATATALAPGTYTVTITDAHGCSHVEEAVVSVTVGAQEAVTQPLRIYPNPAATQCTIEFPNSAHKAHTLSLYDMAGRRLRLIEGITGSSITLDRGALPSGTYRVQVDGNGTSWGGQVRLQ